MARKLRVQYSGAIYHVMNRGDRREPIFKDDQDRECFLATLGEACAPSRRPEWLRVDRLLGEWRVAADSAEGRRRFAANGRKSIGHGRTETRDATRHAHREKMRG